MFMLPGIEGTSYRVVDDLDCREGKLLAIDAHMDIQWEYTGLHGYSYTCTGHIDTFSWMYMAVSNSIAGACKTCNLK